MDISIYGAGYVGLVTATCFASVGHHVVVVDCDEKKVAKLNSGQSPIYEPGLTELLKEALAKGNLIITTDRYAALNHSYCQMIAVGTPRKPSGEADLSQVMSVASFIANHANEDKLIITKSTVPVGTTNKVMHFANELVKSREKQIKIETCSNPEFLKEGEAISDFMHPDRVVIGAKSEAISQTVAELYLPILSGQSCKILHVDLTAGELIKYASNALLATKISFMNEISLIADKAQVDIEQVRSGLALDPRIGPHFIRAGCGFGGSCFPKDVAALTMTAKDLGIMPNMLMAVESVNAYQKSVIVEKIKTYYQDELIGKRIAVWGLAFKPGTDDIRDASSQVIVEALLNQGVILSCYDPIAMDNFKTVYPESEHMQYFATRHTALNNADALVVITEWEEFTTVSPKELAHQLRDKVIFDGRNIFSIKQCQKAGVSYFGIGRNAEYVSSLEKDKHVMETVD